MKTLPLLASTLVLVGCGSKEEPAAAPPASTPVAAQVTPAPSAAPVTTPPLMGASASPSAPVVSGPPMGATTGSSTPAASPTSDASNQGMQSVKPGEAGSR